MKNLFFIFSALTIIAVSSDIPLGETFIGDFGSFIDGALGKCGINFDYSTYKAVWISIEWFKEFKDEICQYCLMIEYNGIRKIYPITDECPYRSTKDQGILSLFAFQDFANPDKDDEIVGANFTFVNCLTTTEILSTTKLLTTAITDPSTDVNEEMSSTLGISTSVNSTTTTKSTTKVMTTSTENSSPTFHTIKFFKIFFIVLCHIYLFKSHF